MPILVAALDAVIIALAVITGVIIAVDGFVVHLGDLDLRFRTPARTLLWLALALAVRFIAYRRALPFGLTGATWARLLVVPAGGDSFRVRAVPGLGRRVLLASIGIAAVVTIVMHDTVAHPISVPDYGDPLFSMWRMGWVRHQLLADPIHLFDANIFYPERLTLTFSDPIILPALLQAPLIGIGVSHVVAYNVLFLAAVWASGVATYILVERITGSAAAAFVAGVVYACYPYRFDHMSHLELQMTQWMPLGLLALHLFTATGRPVYAFGLAAAVVAQLYSSMYYAVFFVIFATTIGIGLILTHRPPVRRMILPLVGAALVAGAVSAPLVRAFVAAHALKGDRPVEEVTFYSGKFADYLRPQKYSVWWAERLPPPEPERALFPGAAPLVLAAVGLAPPVSAVRLVYAAGLLVSLDASRGFNGVIYPLLYRWFPPVRGLRVPARFSVVVGLGLAVFAGFGVRRLIRLTRSSGGMRLIFLAITAAVVVDAFSHVPTIPVWTQPPAIYERVKDNPAVVLAELPVTSMEHLNVPFMYLSLWHWRPMVNGYSGFLPRSYYEMVPALIDFPRGTTPDVLRQRGVTHVTINCGLRYAGCEETAGLMRTSQDVRLIAETRWEGAPVQLYELIPR